MSESWLLCRRNLTPVPHETSLHTGKGHAFPFVPGQVNGQAFRQFDDDWERIGIRFRPERTQFTQEYVYGDRPYAVESKEPLLEILRIPCRVVQATQFAAIFGNKRIAVTQHLRRLASVVADVAAFTHDGINEEVPASIPDFFRTDQAVASEASIGVLCRRFGNPRPEQKAGKKPAK